MILRRPAKVVRQLSSALVLIAGLSTCLPSWSDDSATENAQLTLLLRQLDMLERTAQESAKLPARADRYHFDYARLYADIARIRAGIQDYLLPQRAQPRDAAALHGEYREEQPTP